MSGPEPPHIRELLEARLQTYPGRLVSAIDYYGTVTADGAEAVGDQNTRKTARLIDGQYFILVERQTNNCEGCDNIQAINSAGRALPANYGPEQYRRP